MLETEALATFDADLDRLFLVGDHHQLEPVVRALSSVVGCHSPASSLSVSVRDGGRGKSLRTSLGPVSHPEAGVQLPSISLCPLLAPGSGPRDARHASTCHSAARRPVPLALQVTALARLCCGCPAGARSRSDVPPGLRQCRAQGIRSCRGKPHGTTASALRERARHPSTPETPVALPLPHVGSGMDLYLRRVSGGARGPGPGNCHPHALSQATSVSAAVHSKAGGR